MKNKKTKIAFFNFMPYECEAAEEYLEAMAEKGWMLKSVTGAFLKFTQIEAKKIKYSVDVFNKISDLDPEDTDIALEYREYCRAAGWNYVCHKGKIQIFCTEDYENTIDIHTDAEEKFRSVFKASLYSIGGQLFLTLLFIFNLYIQLFEGSTDYALATNLGLFSVIGMASIVIINCIDIINFIIWSIKARLHIKENKIMSYSNGKQIIRKNMFKSGYVLLMLLILLKLTIFGDYEDKISSVSVLLLILILCLISVFSQIFINKKRCSKNTILAITIVITIVSIFIITSFAANSALKSISKNEQGEERVEKASLTFVDFGYKQNYDKNPYIQFDKSIVAKRKNCYLDNEGHSLNYTIFESPYPWIINFDENRLISRLNSYDNDLKQINTHLSNNIKVYSDSKKKDYVLVSEDKVVNIRKDLDNIDEEKFLSIVYNKLFVK